MTAGLNDEDGVDEADDSNAAGVNNNGNVLGDCGSESESDESDDVLDDDDDVELLDEHVTEDIDVVVSEPIDNF
jgi:hypothetical protein